MNLGPLDRDFCTECGRSHRHQVTDFPVGSYAMINDYGLCRVTSHCDDGRATFVILEGDKVDEVHTFHDGDGWLLHTIRIETIDLEEQIIMGVVVLGLADGIPQPPRVDRIDRNHGIHITCTIDGEWRAQRVMISTAEKNDYMLKREPETIRRLVDFAAKQVYALLNQ